MNRIGKINLINTSVAYLTIQAEAMNATLSDISIGCFNSKACDFNDNISRLFRLEDNVLAYLPDDKDLDNISSDDFSTMESLFADLLDACNNILCCAEHLTTFNALDEEVQQELNEINKFIPTLNAATEAFTQFLSTVDLSGHHPIPA